MIKSELKEIETGKSKQFPILAKSKHNESVFLFWEDKCGMCIVPGNNPNANRLGVHGEYWNSIYSPENWEILPAGTEVILRVS